MELTARPKDVQAVIVLKQDYQQILKYLNLI